MDSSQLGAVSALGIRYDHFRTERKRAARGDDLGRFGLGHRPLRQKTAATMNPGLAYVGDTWQVAAEAIVPLNSEGGRTIGVRAHLFLFLDDLIPAVFGKPLLESVTHVRPEARERR